MKGTNTGEFNGMPATNKEFTFGVISVFVFEDGKVKEINEAADFFGFMNQLGYMQ
jgi:predicted ester cyclase